MSVTAVVFDLDGVILDSEDVWHSVRAEYVRRHGGQWTEKDQRAVMGANSSQWATYIRDNCGVRQTDSEIYSGVVGELRARYSRHLPLIAGAKETVQDLAKSFPLGVASSSPAELIEHALALAGLLGSFRVVVSSDEVAFGKPAPDVYLKACSKLAVAPQRSAAVEDSENGLRSAAAAGMKVVAIPSRDFPPGRETLKLADIVLPAIRDLSADVVAHLGAPPPP
jgi:HAD superfamily hydrolase (TIGR01509 family)